MDQTSDKEAADAAVRASLRNRASAKAVDHLLGMVEGMLADGHLHDREIQLLSTWLAENREACDSWPLSAVCRMVRDALADGVITEEERLHLMANLQAMVGNVFWESGSASPEVAALPIEDAVTVQLLHASVCLTGTFLYGTRASCERLALKAGAVIADTVTRKLDYLVIGTRVSPDWAHGSFGRKIQKAMELQERGHPVEIISERRWLEALGEAVAA